MSNDQRDKVARAHEHLRLSDLRKNPGGEVRLLSTEGKLISGTYAFQVARSIDAMIHAAFAPRTITTTEELDALPDGSAIRDSNALLLEVDSQQGSSSWLTGWFYGDERVEPALPATVLHEPIIEATA